MNPRVVVADASAVVEVLRRTTFGDRVATILRGSEVAAPANLDSEVLSALGRLARAGRVADADVERGIDRLVRLPVERYPLPPLLRRAWALRHNISLRDGLYVACSEVVGGVLLTLDGRLARGAPVSVEHIQ